MSSVVADDKDLYHIYTRCCTWYMILPVILSQDKDTSMYNSRVSLAMFVYCSVLNRYSRWYMLTCVV